MKKYFALFLLCAFAIACNKKEEDTITVTPATYSASYEGDSFTVTVTANGDYTAEANVTWLKVEDTKVTIEENEETSERSGIITFTNGSASATVTVSQGATPVYNEIQSDPANCYIVSEAGNYKFKATVMGNGDAGLHSTFPIKSTTIAPVDAKLVWEEVEGLITNVKLKDGYIQFTCANKDGNAVLAATDKEGAVLWSWHIWSAEAPKDVVCNDTFTLMDRNLGATATGVAAEAYGLYYQFGRKDPFSRTIAFDSGAGEGWYHPVVGGGDDESNTAIHAIPYSIAHPEEYIAKSNRNNDWLIEANQRYVWGINWELDGNIDYPAFKSLFDPCPAGYVVATPNCLAAGLASGGSRESDNSVKMFDGKISVPAAGFVYNGGFGWYDADGAGWTGLWTCSTSWGNTENGFRLKSNEDARDNYDRACAHPVRCLKLK